MKRAATAGAILPLPKDIPIPLYDKLQRQGDTLPLPAAAWAVLRHAKDGFLSKAGAKSAPDGRPLYRGFVKKDDGFCAFIGFLPDDADLHKPLERGRGPWQEPRPHSPINAEPDAVFLAFADGDIGLYNRILDFADMRTAKGKEIRTAGQAGDVVRALAYAVADEQEPRTALFNILGAAIEARAIIPRAVHEQGSSAPAPTSRTEPANNTISLSDLLDSKKRRL